MRNVSSPRRQGDREEGASQQPSPAPISGTSRLTGFLLDSGKAGSLIRLLSATGDKAGQAAERGPEPRQGGRVAAAFVVKAGQAEGQPQCASRNGGFPSRQSGDSLEMMWWREVVSNPARNDSKGQRPEKNANCEPWRT